MATEDIVVPGFTSNVLQVLYSMQQQGRLCDALVHTAGGSVPAHRIVLMAGSPYLRCREDEQNTPNFCHSNHYLMSELKEDVENVIRFLYIGITSVSRENVSRLIRLGGYLQLHSLVEVCKSYAEKYSCVKNVCDTDRSVIKSGNSNCSNIGGFSNNGEFLLRNIGDIKVTDYAAKQIVSEENDISRLNTTSSDMRIQISNAFNSTEKNITQPESYHCNNTNNKAFENNVSTTYLSLNGTSAQHLYHQQYNLATSDTSKHNSSHWRDTHHQGSNNDIDLTTNQTKTQPFSSCNSAGNQAADQLICGDLGFVAFPSTYTSNSNQQRKAIREDASESFDSVDDDTFTKDSTNMEIDETEKARNDDQSPVPQNQTEPGCRVQQDSAETSENNSLTLQSDIKYGDKLNLSNSVVTKTTMQESSKDDQTCKFKSEIAEPCVNATNLSKISTNLSGKHRKEERSKSGENVDVKGRKLLHKTGRFSKSNLCRNKKLTNSNSLKGKVCKRNNLKRDSKSSKESKSETKSMNMRHCQRSRKDFRSKKTKFVKSESEVENIHSDTETRSKNNSGDTKLYMCRRCMEPFRTHQERSDHIKLAHAGGIVVCNVCNFSYKNVDWKYMMEHRYKKHNQMLETDKCPVYSCPEQGCGYKTLFKTRYKHHMDLVHLKERPYPCSQCQKSFKCQKNLTVHQRTHLDSYVREIFQCEQCGKKFKANSSLKRHIEKVHEKINEAKQLCHLCTYQATNYRSMHNHLLKAHGIQPPKHVKVYQCSKCDFITLTKSHLAEHEGGHAGSTSQFVCQVCGKIFQTERRLNNHSKIHIAEELTCPYEECNFHCKEKKNLRRHIQRQHDPNNYKPYGCPHCNYCCKEKGNLNKHITAKHKVEVVTLYKLRQKAMETGKGYPNISCNEYPSTQMSSALEINRV